ncbi:MAG TPA: hypothetical protein VE863_20180, partial [Pyrinomonadaceae bacterium]|nr:hypothetical protein [Pyrinomonadaceae bacterium]
MTLRSLIVCALLALCAVGGRAQSSRQFFTANPAKTAASSLPKGRPKSPQPSEPSNARDDDAGAPAAERAKPQFRVERLPLASGAELLTIFGRLDGMRGVNGNAPEVPLISVVRDTLNDSDTD